MIHTVRGFSVVNEVEVDVFLEFSCFFYVPVNIGNLVFGSSVFSKSNLKFSVHILLKPSMRPWFNPWVGKMPWRRTWQPTPIFLPRKSHGQRSLMGYSPWNHKQVNTTEQLTLSSLSPDTWIHISLFPCKELRFLPPDLFVQSLSRV